MIVEQWRYCRTISLLFGFSHVLLVQAWNLPWKTHGREKDSGTVDIMKIMKKCCVWSFEERPQ
jgi:hypothetical protein